MSITDTDLDQPSTGDRATLFRNCHAMHEWLIENLPANQQTAMVVPAFGEWDKPPCDVSLQIEALLNHFHPVVYIASGISTSTLIGCDWVAAFRRGRGVPLLFGREVALHAHRLLIDRVCNEHKPIHWKEYLRELYAPGYRLHKDTPQLMPREPSEPL